MAHIFSLGEIGSEAVPERTLIIIAGIAAIPGIVGAVMAYLAQRHARQANDAVNHRHNRMDENGDHPPKAYDALLEIHKRQGQIAGHMEDAMADLAEIKTDVVTLKEWQARWVGLPEEVSSALAVEKHLKFMDGMLIQNMKDHEFIIGMIHEKQKETPSE